MKYSILIAVMLGLLSMSAFADTVAGDCTGATVDGEGSETTVTGVTGTGTTGTQTGTR